MYVSTAGRYKYQKDTTSAKIKYYISGKDYDT